MVTLNKDHYFENNIFRVESKKEKIVLINTLAPIEDYLTKLSLRYNKKYTKIPTFTIDRNGVIYQHLNPDKYSKILDNDSLDSQAIVIALENVGWLNFDPIFQDYCDWRGNLYEGSVIEIPWRNKKYWAAYTNEQFSSLIHLIDYLCNEHTINKNFIGNNVLSGIKNFKGIINRSNFSKNHFDLSPAFDFEELTKQINNI